MYKTVFAGTLLLIREFWRRALDKLVAKARVVEAAPAAATCGAISLPTCVHTLPYPVEPDQYHFEQDTFSRFAEGN